MCVCVLLAWMVLWMPLSLDSHGQFSSVGDGNAAYDNKVTEQALAALKVLGVQVMKTAYTWLHAERDRLRALPKKQAKVKSAAEMFGSRQMSYYR